MPPDALWCWLIVNDKAVLDRETRGCLSSLVMPDRCDTLPLVLETLGASTASRKARTSVGRWQRYGLRARKLQGRTPISLDLLCAILFTTHLARPLRKTMSLPLGQCNITREEDMKEAANLLEASIQRTLVTLLAAVRRYQARVSRTWLQSLLKIGGEGGDRTHGPVARTAVFETARFGHSRTSPHVELIS